LSFFIEYATTIYMWGITNYPQAVSIMLNKDFLSILYIQLSRCVWVLFLIYIKSYGNRNPNFDLITDTQCTVHVQQCTQKTWKWSKHLQRPLIWAFEICNLMTFAVRNFVITFEGRDIRKDFLGVAKKKKKCNQGPHQRSALLHSISLQSFLKY